MGDKKGFGNQIKTLTAAMNAEDQKTRTRYLVLGIVIALSSLVMGVLQATRSMNIDAWQSDYESRSVSSSLVSYDFAPLSMTTCKQWYDVQLAQKMINDYKSEFCSGKEISEC